MRFTTIFLFFTLTVGVYADNTSLIQGFWQADSRAFLGYGFEIKNNKISFIGKSCLNNQFEIIKEFQNKITTSWNKQTDIYNSFILKIKYNKTLECMNVKSRIHEYIRMSFPTEIKCYPTIYFYSSANKLNEDEKNNWSASGYVGFGNFSKGKKCN